MAKANPDRRGDIERTAQELARIKYVKDNILAKRPYLSPYVLEVLIRANASDLSSNAFRELFTWATFANKDGTNAFPEQQTIADITGLSVSTLERATAELKDLGWQETERITRRGKSIAYRTLKIPSQATSSEILETSPVTALKRKNKVRNLDSSKVLNRHPCGEGTVTGEGLPISSDQRRDNHSTGTTLVLVGGEASEVGRQTDAVAQPKVAGYRDARTGGKGATL